MSLHARTPRPALRPLPRLLRLTLLSLAAGACLPLHAAEAEATLEADPTLPAITITGQAAQATEGTQSYTSGAARSATRMELSLRETPQSVSIITRELLDDLGAVRLDQALGLTTGIQVGQQDSERTSFYARGFSINNIQVDGMPRGSNSPLQDTVLYDRVEVVRGANGLMGGTGDPSATST